ncbi:MAG: S-layer homology domain-containing protein [Candidatus Gracilibacteria bacterium]|jgi:hypothetical protein
MKKILFILAIITILGAIAFAASQSDILKGFIFQKFDGAERDLSSINETTNQESQPNGQEDSLITTMENHLEAIKTQKNIAYEYESKAKQNLEEVKSAYETNNSIQLETANTNLNTNVIKVMNAKDSATPDFTANTEIYNSYSDGVPDLAEKYYKESQVLMDDIDTLVTNAESYEKEAEKYKLTPTELVCTNITLNPSIYEMDATDVKANFSFTAKFNGAKETDTITIKSNGSGTLKANGPYTGKEIDVTATESIPFTVSASGFSNGDSIRVYSQSDTDCSASILITQEKKSLTATPPATTTPPPTPPATPTSTQKPDKETEPDSPDIIIIDNTTVTPDDSSITTPDTEINDCSKSASEFLDANGHWAEFYIDEMTNNCYMEGRTTTLFAPDAPLTKAEAIKVIIRILGYDDPLTTNTGFTDVENHWALPYIAMAEALDIIRNYDDFDGDGIGNSFTPDYPITRGEFVIYLVRAAGKTLYDYEIPFSDLTYSDPWTYAVAIVNEKYNFVDGYYNNTFRPNNIVTRAEATKILYGALETDFFENAMQ